MFAILGTSFFSAYGMLANPSTTYIRFPYVIVNEGGDYNASSGVFTCRILGMYWLATTLTKILQPNIGYIYCVVRINGSDMLQLYTDLVTDETAAYSMSASAGFHLRLGDQVQVGDCANANYIYSDKRTHFSGFLVKPDA